MCCVDIRVCCVCCFEVGSSRVMFAKRLFISFLSLKCESSAVHPKRKFDANEETFISAPSYTASLKRNVVSAELRRNPRGGRIYLAILCIIFFCPFFRLIASYLYYRNPFCPTFPTFFHVLISPFPVSSVHPFFI